MNEVKLRTLVIEIQFDTEDVENAYLAAQDAIMNIERWESVESVRVLGGVADEEVFGET